MHIKYFLCCYTANDTETLSIGHPTYALLNRRFVSVGMVTWVLIIDHMTALR